MTDDSTALQRLLPFVEDAINAQDVAVRDQLWAAFHAGDTTIRTEPSAVGAVVIVVVGGHPVTEVDLRNLVRDDGDDE